MAVCQLVPATDAFASGMIAYLDCQAQAIGMLGYGTLAAPGSSASLLLTALLTIFVAMIGIRLLFGETPGIGDVVMWLVKIGIVTAVATSWPAYRTLVYDVALRAPAQIAGEIGMPAGLPGAGGGLPARLDGADRAFSTLAAAGVGLRSVEQGRSSVAASPSPFPGFDMFALGMARIAFLGSAVGSFALLRLTAGLLLALGPLFVAFLLISATRGLFEGWARALIGTALGSIATSIVLGVELALLEPWLQVLIARRAAGLDITGVPGQLFATTFIFAGVLAVLIGLLGRVAIGLRSPQIRLGATSLLARREPVQRFADFDMQHDRVNPVAVLSRADRVSQSIATAQRHEEAQTRLVSGAVSPVVASSNGNRIDAGSSFAMPGLGQSYRRRAGNRASASASARDRR